MDSQTEELPVALTIAGSDSGGGAGIQADLLTFAALGVFGTTAISALTAQNPDGVSGVHAVPALFVKEQAEQVARFFKVRAAKTGMLANAEIISAVADFFEAHREILLVVDPVMIATSGAKLIGDEAISVLRDRLIPLASVVTPNLDEAEVLLGEKYAWRGNGEFTGDIEEKAMTDAAEKLSDALGVPVLLKGGHGNGGAIFDVFCGVPVLAGTMRGNEPRRSFPIRHPRIEKTNTHGSGCTLSAAIAAELAASSASVSSSDDAAAQLENAVRQAVAYVCAGIGHPLPVSGERFIAHLVSKKH